LWGLDQNKVEIPLSLGESSGAEVLGWEKKRVGYWFDPGASRVKGPGLKKIKHLLAELWCLRTAGECRDCVGQKNWKKNCVALGAKV